MASLRLIPVMLVVALCGTVTGYAQTATATTTPTPGPTPSAPAETEWVVGSDLVMPQGGGTRVIARGGVIEARLSPDEAYIAFTRGAQGFPNTLWVIGADGTDARELVGRDNLVSSGGRPFVLDFDWLNDESILFNTAQEYVEGVVNDDNLYRADLDGTVALMLPPRSGGEFAVSPDRQWIGVVTPGEQGVWGGVVRMVPPDAALIHEMLIYEEPGSSQEPKYYPPIRWRDDVMFMRLPEVLPEGETRYECWQIPSPRPEGSDTRIYGYARESELREDWC